MSLSYETTPIAGNNAMATLPGLGHVPKQQGRTITPSPTSVGQYTFLKLGPGQSGNTKDPVSESHYYGYSQDMVNRIKNSKHVVQQTQRQIRFNEKNRSSALPQIQGGGFTADYHQAAAAHDYMTKNYLLLGIIALGLILLVNRG